MATARIRITGLADAVNALDPAILATPARKLLERTGITVQGKARKKAPVDRGGLRDSITYQVDTSYFPRYVEVGSNLEYARATELGRPPGKMPPSGPLEVWAARHPKPGGYEPGDGFALALKIMREGIKERPYLEPALNESIPQIRRFVTQMGRDIEQEAAKRGGGA